MKLERLVILLVMFLPTIALGQTWEPLSPTASAPVVSMSVKPNGDILALCNNQVFVSTDIGTSWSLFYTPPFGIGVQILFVPPSSVFLLTQKDTIASGYRIFRLLASSNNGVDWASILAYSAPGGAPKLAADSLGDILVSIAAGEFHITTNGGGSWRALHEAYVWAVHISPSRAFCYVAPSGFYRSTDLGMSWRRTSFGGPLPIDKILTSQQLMFFGTGSKVYRSIDSGVTWIPVLTINDRTLDQGLVDDVFVGTTAGLYRTINGGDSWQEAGIPSVSVVSVAVHRSGSILVGSTTGLLYRKNLANAVESSPEHPKEFSLKQNYPNPFNPTTKISFQIPTQTFVQLKVFDLLGREVATLVNEEMNPGSYEKQFDGSGLASGIYLYQIKAGAFVQTKKLVLMR